MMRRFVRRNRVGIGTVLAQERDQVQREAEKTARVKTLVSDLFKVVDPNAVQGSPVERLEAVFPPPYVDTLFDGP